MFDRLAAGSCLYDYPAESLAKLKALVPQGGRVLDVGCGDGTIGATFDSDLHVSFDISPRCASLAASRGQAALVADAASGLPFADAAFDTVACMDVLHHLGQAWDAVFSELDRVLRPGGALVIIEPDARNPFVRWTQAPGSPIRVAPCDDEPAIDPAALLPHLEGRGYASELTATNIDGAQVERAVFPLWQRLLKAPFVLGLAWWCRGRPSKFAIVARKPA
jgi:SAM-dependent methyltransferase